MNTLRTVLLTIALTGCVSYAFAADVVVTAGKKITLDYTLTVNKEELETSVGKQPLVFVDGDRSMIPGLEKGIEGMKKGEEKVIVVEPKDAYGEIDPKAVKEFPKSNLPASPEPKVGMVLQAKAPDGETFPATIAEIKGDKVELDFNHPLAGKQLSFKVKILDITDAPAVPAAAPLAAPTK